MFSHLQNIWDANMVLSEAIHGVHITIVVYYAVHITFNNGRMYYYTTIAFNSSTTTGWFHRTVNFFLAGPKIT